MLLQTVALKEVKFYAKHGYYPEEQLTGSHFLVDVEVTFFPQGDAENLDKTVNYEALNQILQEEMSHTQKLLETVVQNILQRLIAGYDFLKSVTVGIKKIRPPMLGEIGHSFVQLTYIAD